VSVYIITLTHGADRQAVIDSLALLGTVSEFEFIPRTLKWEGPSSAEASIMQIEGVQSLVLDSPTAVSPLSTHDVTYGMYEGSAQLPLVWSGRRKGQMLYGSAFDLQREGQKAVFDYDPTVDEGDGSDTRVYIVDSGVLSTHPEFSGRYGGLIYDPHSGSPGQHGMTCATLALGLTMGVAPGATVMDVRSFPETGGTSTSNIISGLNACISSHNSGSVPGVVNCSFGAVETSDPFNAPVEACVDAGLLLVAAAGNRQLDLTTGTNEWPAENPDAITVGGHDKQYKIHPFSNRFGEVDLYAPYHGHTPANPSGGFVGHMSWRGTSFSAPMAAGMIARMMTGAAKLTTRAEVQSLRAEFMSKYTVAGVRERDGSELLNVRRLYIPGVTFTGFSAETPPARGVS
jgi:hypothetical protein